MSHLIKKKSKKKNIPVDPPPKDPDFSTPTQGELMDAFIHLEDIRENFKAAYEAHKVKYTAEIIRYVKYKYANYAVFTEVVNTFFENLKIIMEVTKKNENKS